MYARYILTIALIMLALAACSQTSTTQDPSSAPAIDPNNAALVSEGQEIYATHCAACHGPNLEGQPNWREPLPNGQLPAPPHDASGHTWHHPDTMLFGITKQGGAPYAPLDYPSGMPAYASILSDREIWAVLSYIKSQWPEEIQQQHDTLN